MSNKVSLDYLLYNDLIVKSGIDEDAAQLNFLSSQGIAVYERLYRETDRTTNGDSSGGSSLEAARNLARCTGSAGHTLGNKFYLLSDLAGDTKAARFGIIKEKGIYWSAGQTARGWVCNGRFRQLDGIPLGYKQNKNGEWEPRRYFQPKGESLEIFCPLVNIRIWQLVAAKANLPMPEFPAIGLRGEALGFWEWVIESDCPIVITEGEKKAAALVSRGYAAIGLPGITTGYRVTEHGETVTKPDGTTYQKALARELHETLQPFDTDGRLITVVFDHRVGDYLQSAEFKAASTLSKLFKSAVVKVAQLPGPDKGVDDFCVAGGSLDKIIADAQDCRKLEIKAQWRHNRQYPSDVVINSQYFHASEPAPNTITAIKSGLATGKTQWLQDIVASNPNGKIIVIGSRNGLLLQTAEKCGFYHLDAHNGYLMFRDPNARLCLCFDSLLKLPPEIFEGATIILDEAESVTRHLLMSNTLKQNREAIKQFFTQACKDASRIILLDGHLTGYTVNLIAKLAGNKTVTKYLNEFKGNCPKISIYETEKSTPTAAETQDYINRILASECPVIVTDCSVAEAEALAETLTEAKGVGLLICSKTSNNPDEIEVQTSPDVHIKKYNWVILSPSVENGLDISIREKFTDVFGLFCGLLGVNSLIQMLRRVRHPINQISVLCPQIGLINSERRSYYTNQIKYQIEATISIESTLLCPSEHEEAIRTDILRQLEEPLFYAYCHYEAQENLEKSNLREFLIEALRDGGYEVDEPTLGEDESGDHANKKIVCKEKESQEIFNSPDITFEEAQEISRSNKARWPERCQAEKAFLKARLPTIENTELWMWEFIHRIRGKDSSLLSHLENSWLFHNPDDAEYLQKSKWDCEKLETFLPDHSTSWLKLRTLRELNIVQFVNPDSFWTNESPEIKKLLKGGERKGIRKILGEPGKDGIKYVNKLLGLIGVKLVSRAGRGEDGKWQRTYHYQPEPTWKETKAGPQRECSLPEDWSELAELTAVRMSQKVEFKKASVKSAESDAVSALDPVADVPDFINTKLETSATETESETEPKAETTTPQITPWTGWAWRWTKWHEARIIGRCKEGTRHLVEYLSDCGDIREMLVDPKSFSLASEVAHES